MKYGDKFEKESVPEWSLHNIDYNSLKHYIKAHTTKDQARAIAIPGQADDSLSRVEDELYLELCRQHDRVDLFVASKADEIARRLQYDSDQIHRLILRSAHSDRTKMPVKRQRKFAKYEREVIHCGEEIQALQRFVNAQIIAFRKILKKYKKWTGSASLSARFRENVLSHPKSFTKRDFSQLQQTYEELLQDLRAASPVTSEPSTPLTDAATIVPSRQSSGDQLSPRRVEFQEGPPETRSFHREEVRYWNEYEDGSEAGDFDDGYAIYIQPDDGHSPPYVTAILAAFSVPIEKARAWLQHRKSAEHAPLLPTDVQQRSAPQGYGGVDDTSRSGPDNSQQANGESYFTDPPGRSATGLSTAATAASNTDTDADDEDDTGFEYASSEEFPIGYAAHYAALPSINDQRMRRYRERVLLLGTVGSFAAAFALLAIAAILISTGRHRLAAEVDAGVAVGVAASLGCACTALGMTMARRDDITWLQRAAIGLAFAAVCVLNGMLLVLVMGNTSL